MKKLILGTLFSALLVLNTGCNFKIIDKVTFALNPNLESARVSLIFAKDIQTDIGGTFSVKDYGYVFANPSTPDAPFNVGFDLNLSIVNDNDYIHYTPTTKLPSDDPLPTLINRALAQIQLEKPVGQKFDVYAYVDILGREWLGVAMILNYIDQKNFPAGLSFSRNFLKDKQGVPRAAAVIFGPKVDSAGNLVVPGGIALFANVAALIKGNGDIAGADSGSDGMVFFNGALISPTPSSPL